MSSVSATDVTATSFTINWSPLPDATKTTVLLQQQTPQGNYTHSDWKLTELPSNTTSHTFLSLRPNTNFRVIVRQTTPTRGDVDTPEYGVATLGDIPLCNNTIDNTFTKPLPIESIILPAVALFLCVTASIVYYNLSNGWGVEGFVTLAIALGLLAITLVGAVKVYTLRVQAVKEQCIDPITFELHTPPPTTVASIQATTVSTE